MLVSVQVGLSQSVNAEDVVLTDSEKQLCQTWVGFTLITNGASGEDVKDGDTIRLGQDHTTVALRCQSSGFCKANDATVGGEILFESCDDGKTPPATGNGDFPAPPATIPAGAKALIDLMCGSYKGQQKKDCIGIVANIYSNGCYDSRENADKLGDWSECVYKSLVLNWVIFKDHYSNAKSVPPQAKIEEKLKQGMAATEAAMTEATKRECIDGGGTYNEKDGTCTEKSETSCAVDGVGWMVCPVMTFLGKMTDLAFSFLASSFLETDAAYVETGGPAYNAWAIMRNFANVAFVIAFLIIIYAQITGMGITNYGIKKLLPKIIIAAILVNVSFFICQLAVDISNIAGYSIKSLFDSLGTLIQTGNTYTDTTRNPIQTGALILAIIAAGISLALAISIPLILAVLLALVLILFILMARTALIILLIVISPLAFVAYLLPNTEQWFQKWRKMFINLLLLFPIIATVFGASSLAAQIVKDAAEKSGDTSEIMQLIALGIAAVPLFAVPVLLKGALAAAGAIGNKLSGLQDRANKRATGAASKTAGDRFKRRGENIEAKMATSGNRFARLAGGYRNRRAFGHKSIESETARMQQQALTAQILRNPGNYTPRQLAEAKSASLKEYNEEVGREKSTMSDLEHSDLMNIVKDKNASEERRAAAAGVIGSRSFRKGHQELLDYLGDESHVGAGGKVDEAIKTVQQQTAYDMKDQPLGMGDADKSALGEGRFIKPRGVNTAGVQRTVSQEGMLQRLHEGKVSEQAFASMNPDDLALVQQLKAGGHLTPEAQATIDGLIDRLNSPEMATVYAASKDNARKIHATLHS